MYSTAGVRLLNRPLSADYRRERTEHFAQSRQEAPSRSVGTAPARVSAVLFRLSNEWLALPTQAFQEVAERRLVHSLPHRRQGIVLGLVNVRGELLICVSLGRLLGVENIPTPGAAPSCRETLIKTHARLLVVNSDIQCGTSCRNRLVFPVDEVHGIHRFQPEELKEAPATVAKSNPTYTQGVLLWRDRAIGFLDADSLFSSLNRSLT